MDLSRTLGIKHILRTLLLGTFLSLPLSASGQQISALVESVTDGVVNIAPFDLLSVGDRVDLGADEVLVVNYFASCVREQIQGGVVVVGTDRSELANASRVESTILPCAGSELSLAANQLQNSGATAFRAIQEDLEPRTVITSLSPVIIASGGAKVVIKRIDQKADRISLRLDESDTASQIDLAEQQIELSPGATYLLTAGTKTMIFGVSEHAIGLNKGALLGRLLIP